MTKQNAILIFDIGKTNKKIILFNEQYNVIHEESTQLNETIDEDGFPCDDVNALTNWIQQKYSGILLRKDVDVKAVNFSAYGASMVYVNDAKKPVTPLYNYLKPYPKKLKQQFYNTYGSESLLAKQTASPVSGSLNSGLQLYRLKYEHPEVYEQIKHALHLPQYLSCVISSKPAADITSIGCHTHLWDFQKNKYHDWVYKEAFNKKFPPIYKSDKPISIIIRGKKISVGIGLHDSSSALIPYLKSFIEPFVLLSTGTWCISLNPFNHSALTNDELNNDCLCYLSYDGKPVKASRLFAGYQHEQQVKRLADYFHNPIHYYNTIKYDAAILKKLQRMKTNEKTNSSTAIIQQSSFERHELANFETSEEAYHQLVLDIMLQQIRSVKLVLQGAPVKKIFVDGGFTNNAVYMNLLATAFPYIEVFAANTPQASALGAAIVMHDHWNSVSLPENLIQLKHFKATKNVLL